MKAITIAIILTVLVGCGISYNLQKSSSSQAELERIRIEQIEERSRQEAAQRRAQEQRIRPAYPMAPPAPPPPPAPVPYVLPGTPAKPKPIVPAAPKVESVSSKLFSASLAFAVKDRANIEEDIKAQLLIDPNQTVADLEQQLSVKGNSTGKTIQISEVVKATLTAPDFEVTKITDEEQVVSDHKATEWLWSLKPKSAGTHEINLSVTAIVKINGRESRHHLKTFEQTVLVEVTNSQVVENWLSEHWKWIVSTLIIPVLVFLFKDRFKKKSSE